MSRTFYIADANGDTSFQHVTLDILSEPICMNVGVALMPFMENGFHFIKEENIFKSEYEEGLNDVETGFVKYLYKIRQANRNKTTLAYTSISGPNRFNRRERIFIGGKIFPVMSISYGSNFSGGTLGFGKEDADCSSSKMEIKSVSTYELKILFGESLNEYYAFSKQYISVDNDKIKIYLPKETEIGVDYPSLMKDFLTNGEKTKIATINGEFPDMEIYTMATGISYLTKACWLTKDRKAKTDTWKNACMYIVEHKLLGVLGPFGQIADFYKLLDEKMFETKHKTRWLKGAKKLVDALTILDGGSSFVANDVEVILSELNIGICDYAITQFYELFYGKYKNDHLDTMGKAYSWDLAFVKHEQGVVAVPIYAKTSKNTIQTFQAMADRDASLDPINAIHGIGSWGIKNFWRRVTPEFDEPWNGKVTDAGFRIDLPMLMLWLDKHKPTSTPFKGKVDNKGFLKEEYKKIIRDYEAK